MKLMALDGNSLAYRAFYALPEDMTNASGQATNSVYGFTTMLLTLLREHTQDGIIVVFDRSEPTFRHVAIPEYKAQREKAPDTLYQQLGMIRELLDAMGVMWRDMAGFEGDDLIAVQPRKGFQVLIAVHHLAQIGEPHMAATGQDRVPDEEGGLSGQRAAIENEMFAALVRRASVCWVAVIAGLVVMF